MKKMLLTLLCMMSWSAIASTKIIEQEQQAIEQVLTDFHSAATQADGDKYFNLLTDDAVFLGTDATERWTKDEFKVFALPLFNQGKGWEYTAKERNINFISNIQVAFFDELLYNDFYGYCRGSGVLIKTDQGWKINQYNLTITLPNDISRKITEQIKSYDTQMTKSVNK